MNYICSENLNIILGENGCGKTNFLDSIYYLCLTKSFFNHPDSILINDKTDFFRLESKVQQNKNIYKIAASYSTATKKKITNNDLEYEKLCEHIGKFPVVLFAPDDTDLVRGLGEIRRKFFDTLICQLDELYLQNLVQYNHFLKQRNHFLKQSFINNHLDKSLLDIYDENLIKLNHQIYLKRKEVIDEFIPIFISHYSYISSSKENASISYVSNLEDEKFDFNFKNNFEKDFSAQRTLLGIHTDDFEFELDQKNTKKYASQGQKKSFVLALKLAQFSMMYQKLNIKPILLMDDIFDKLDDERIERLLKMLNNKVFGQVFITDARPERTKSLLVNVDYFELLLEKS